MKLFHSALIFLLGITLLSSCEKAPQQSLLERAQGQWIAEKWVDKINVGHPYPNAIGTSFGYHIQNDSLIVYQVRGTNVENVEVRTTLAPNAKGDRLVATYPVDELTVTMELHIDKDQKLVNRSHIRTTSHVTYYLKRKKFSIPE